ncbi:MAG: glycosyltransferase family 87 protein [Paludibacteraceae bacterium]|nr:glycosyltransferase family 87 protein [Paludibacteraceae bacterium]
MAKETTSELGSFRLFFKRIGQSILNFIKKPIFQNYRFTLGIWIAISILTGFFKFLSHGLHNNYQIYKYVFFNTLQHYPLYATRPEAYADLNHYGPIFSIIIAPFALLPDLIGGSLWLIVLGVFLFYAIKELPLKNYQHQIIYWLTLNSLIIAHTNMQFNTAIAAMIILSYTFTRKEKDMWAAFMIMLGTFVKLYGIVGLAFFFFSKHKPKFVLWCVIWSVVFFVLPMAISSPNFIISQYQAWFHELILKNAHNSSSNSVLQNISLLGMITRSTGHFEWSNTPIILAGLLLFAISFFQIKKWKTDKFQLLTLCSLMNFVVLFSTGSEPNTYIIAIVGVAIWTVIQPRPFSKLDWFLIIFAIVLSSFGPSDLFPKPLYLNFIRPYALQALPCTLIWLKILHEVIFRKSENYLIGE